MCLFFAIALKNLKLTAAGGPPISAMTTASAIAGRRGRSNGPGRQATFDIRTAPQNPINMALAQSAASFKNPCITLPLPLLSRYLKRSSQSLYPLFQPLNVLLCYYRDQSDCRNGGAARKRPCVQGI